MTESAAIRGKRMPFASTPIGVKRDDFDDLTHQSGAPSRVLIEADAPPFSQILATASDAIVTIDGSGSIVLYNQEAERLFGYPSHEIIGRELDILLPPAARASHRGLVDRFAAEQGSQRAMGEASRLHAHHKDGHLIAVDVTISRVRTASGVLMTAVLRRSRADDDTLPDGHEPPAVPPSSAADAAADAPQSDTLFQLFADSAPLGLFRCNAQGDVTYANSRYHGTMLAQASAQTTWLDTIHFDDLPTITHRWQEARRVGAALGAEFRVVGAGDAVAWVLARVVPEGGAATAANASFLGTVLDISARKRTEMVLFEHKRQLQAAQRIAGVGSWRWTLADNTVVWSDEVYRILGVHPVGAPVTFDDYLLAVHPEDRGELSRSLRAALRGVPLRLQHRVCRPDGTVRIVRCQGDVQVDALNNPLCFHGVAHDVTEQVELESRLAHSQKMHTAGRLVAGVAHDVNNLLTVAQLCTEFLSEAAVEHQDIADDVDTLVETLQRAEALTRQLLAFSRQQVLRPRPTCVVAVATDLTRMLQRLIGEGVSLELDVSEACEARVFVDPSQLERVLVNLTVNARDAMNGAGVMRLSVSCGETIGAEDVRPDGPPAGTYQRIQVSDTGSGIARADLERIFEPYFTTKAEGQGTGLGLATVWGIVQQSGGHIEVHSEVGQGTRFDIYFPVYIGDAERAVAAPALLRPQVDAIRPLRVMLLEDDALLRRAFQRILQSGGHQVFPAADGVKAVALADTLAEPVDFIVSDVVMPHMSGPQAVAQLRERWPDVAVLYVSGYVDDAFAGATVEPHLLLQKPVGAVALLAAIQQIRTNGRLDGR